MKAEVVDGFWKRNGRIVHAPASDGSCCCVEGTAAIHCNGHPVNEASARRHQEARAKLAESAKEAFVRLESQQYKADHIWGSEVAVPNHEFRALEDEVADLRYLVSHLVIVLRRNGINPFSKK